MRWYRQVDIRIAGPRQSDVDQLTAIVSQLTLFNKKPDPFPPGENGIEETVDTHPSLFFSIVLAGPALFLLGFWVFKRRLRRRHPKLSRRMLGLFAYSLAFFLCFAAGWFFYGYWHLSTMPVTDDAIRFSVLYGTALTISFCLISPIVALIARCQGR